MYSQPHQNYQSFSNYQYPSNPPNPPYNNNYSQLTNDAYYQSQLSWLYNKLQLLENDNAYLKRCNNRLNKKIEANEVKKSIFENVSFEIIKGLPPNISSDEKKEKEDNKIEKKNIVYTPSKISYDKEKVSDLIKNLNSIEDIINLPEDKFIRHNKYLNKVLKLREPLQELNNLIGLDNIKKEIFKHVIYFIMNDNEMKESNRLHTVIQGPPGVGKTELGKILSSIYLQIGILENDTVNIVKRSDLIGGYLGQTAIKTQEAIDKAMGGVLFIDEAYALGDKDNKDSYSKECLDTLNRNLTENGNKFVCIVAGYENDLQKCFFSTNSGLERRFNFKYTIEKYTDEEMVQIFKHKANLANWNLNIDDEKLLEFFKNNELPFFGGDIERVIFQAQLNASLRIFNNQEYHIDRYFTIDDLDTAIDIVKKKKEEEDERWLHNYI